MSRAAAICAAAIVLLALVAFGGGEDAREGEPRTPTVATLSGGGEDAREGEPPTVATLKGDWLRVYSV